jgi:ABC-2 type transport system permease protein
MAYTGAIDWIFTTQDLGGAYAASLHDLTHTIFGGSNGMVVKMMSYGYLYIPLLTMGLVSREISSGTIKLLYSSPIKISQIILGKFSAMMVYNLLLVLIVALIMIIGVFNITHADVGLLISCLLGTFLLLCTYAAIGLFMSTLTSYQVVAAISTLVALFVLEYIGGLWQGIDVIRDLAYFFGLSRHIGFMVEGLISSVDVLYFMLISAMFLAFSVLKLQSERESKPPIIVAARYIGIVVFCLLIGYVTSRPVFSLYYDATAKKSMTLTPRSQQIIKEMGDSELEVTSYINLLDWNYWSGTPDQRQKDVQRWQPYVRFNPDIKFNYVYYWNTPSADQQLFKQYPGQTVEQIAHHYAKSVHADLNDFITPQQINKIIDLKPEDNKYVMQLKYKGRTTWLRLFKDMQKFPSEAETDAALERLMLKRIPKIAFLEGEAERSIDRFSGRDYSGLANTKDFRYSLINQGFDVEDLNLASGIIPNDIAVLVIADPRTDFSPSVSAKIQSYIDKGGNLMIAGDAPKQSVFNPLLAPLGIKMMDGILIEKSEKNMPSYIGTLVTKEATGIEKALLSPFVDSARVSMPEAVALSFSKNSAYKITPLLTTDARSTWNKKGVFTEDSIAVNYSGKDGDQIGSFPTALALSRRIINREQRIVVTGDADFPSNGEIGKQGTANFYFATHMFGWLVNDEFPLDTSRPKSKDNRLNMTDGGVKRLKIILTWVLPGLLAIVAIIFLIRRKRK